MSKLSKCTCKICLFCHVQIFLRGEKKHMWLSHAHIDSQLSKWNEDSSAATQEDGASAWWPRLASPSHSFSTSTWLCAGSAYIWLPKWSLDLPRDLGDLGDLLGDLLGRSTRKTIYQKVSTRNLTGRLRLPPPKLSGPCKCLESDPTMKSVSPRPWKTTLQVPCISTWGFF